jgi:hypothetical protein
LVGNPNTEATGFWFCHDALKVYWRSY